MKVILLQGISGSGKTTYAQKLLQQAIDGCRPCWVISADDYFMVQTPGGPQYRYDWTKLQEAHDQCFARYWELLHGEDSGTIIVDHTQTKFHELEPYWQAAQHHGWPVEIHRLSCSVEVAAQRNIHRVPLESVARQATRLQQMKLPGGWIVREIT